MENSKCELSGLKLSLVCSRKVKGEVLGYLVR